MRAVNHLKQFIVENEDSFFFTIKFFLDLRIENKIKSWSLQVRCNLADRKKEASKNRKGQIGFEPVSPGY